MVELVLQGDESAIGVPSIPKADLLGLIKGNSNGGAA